MANFGQERKSGVHSVSNCGGGQDSNDFLAVASVARDAAGITRATACVASTIASAIAGAVARVARGATCVTSAVARVASAVHWIDRTVRWVRGRCWGL